MSGDDKPPQTPPSNRSPRALPLPPIEWAEEVVQRDQIKPDPKKFKPSVNVAYAHTKHRR